MAAALIVVSLATSDVVDYLDGAELQCEDSRTLAVELRFILLHDADAIRSHLFPDYSGLRTWTLSDFIYGHFVPDHTGAVLGTDPESQITSTAARRLVRGFFAGLHEEVTWASIDE